MHLTHRSPLRGTIGTILIIILILITIIVSIHTRNEYAELKEFSNALSITVNDQTSTIKHLEEENTSLNAIVSQLEEENKKLKQENTKLKEKANLQTKAQITVKVSKRDFKSYMPYTAITNKSSEQWKLQQSATTDENGIRCLNGKPMVAVGTGWGVSVGDNAVITCDNGNSFEVVIGDIKDNNHTNTENKTTSANNCRCEFIVDSRQLNPTVKTMGNVAVLEQYNGYVINVQKI